MPLQNVLIYMNGNIIWFYQTIYHWLSLVTRYITPMGQFYGEQIEKSVMDAVVWN